jgi:peptidoglycan/LPS O-acetylase OafA/YrhL
MMPLEVIRQAAFVNGAPQGAENRNARASSERIRGLDSIRIVCALWVLFGHVGFFPAVRELDRNSFAGVAARGILGNLFTGSPAVIVFFVISGFCIHYPFRKGGVTPGWRYLARRYLRIGVPAAAAMTFIHFFVPGNPAFDLSAKSGTVVWSLLAEVIYYTLYPLLLVVARRLGWLRILAAAGGLGLLLFVSSPRSLYLPSVGPWLTWVAGLPYWLLGCCLAQAADEDAKLVVTSRQMWEWRLGIWVGASVSSILMFHAHIGFPWTMMLFGPAAYGWLRREIAYHRSRPPWALLEWAGLWSYSIYAMHMVLPDMVRSLGALRHLNQTLGWALLVVLVLAGCYLFYLLVEKPSHWLGRQIRVRPLLPPSRVA